MNKPRLQPPRRATGKSHTFRTTASTERILQRKHAEHGTPITLLVNRAIFDKYPEARTKKDEHPDAESQAILAKINNGA